jgi:hypothetical protein
VERTPVVFTALRRPRTGLILVADDEMDHPVWRGDEEAVEVFAQLLDFIPSRDAR